jgi:transcription antitermination factor NusG
MFCRCAGSVPRETLVIPGVISVIRGGDSIDAISQEEMDNLRRVLNSGLHYEPWNFTPGKLMTIEDGPLRGVSGVPADTEDKRRFMLPVTLIDRSVAVELGNATSYVASVHRRSEARWVE